MRGRLIAWYLETQESERRRRRATKRESGLNYSGGKGNVALTAKEISRLE